jgi:antitoxin VapB
MDHPAPIADPAPLKEGTRIAADDDPDAPREAALFVNARSQAVRIPARWRFQGDRVRIIRDGERLILEPIKVPGLLEHLSRYLGPTPQDADSERLPGSCLLDGSMLFGIVSTETWTPSLIRLVKTSADLATDEISASQLRAAITRPDRLHLVERTEGLLEVVPVLPRPDGLAKQVARIAALPGRDGEKRGASVPWVAAQALATGRTVLTRHPDRYSGVEDLDVMTVDG